MKCISCEGDINPKWKHAIEINVCPNCGGQILETHLKELLSSLRDTMDKLQQYPEQLDDWLLSNYQYIRTNSPQLSQYMPKGYAKPKKEDATTEDINQPEMRKIKLRDGSEVDVIVEKTMNDTKAQEFQDRANPKGKSVKGRILPGVALPKSATDKTNDLKKLKRQIEEEGSKGIISQASLADMIAEEKQGDAEIIMDNGEGLSQEELVAMQTMVNGGEPITTINSDGVDEESRMADRVLHMNMQAKGKSGGSANKDLEYLRQHQTAVADAQARMDGGGGRFTRSGS